MTDAAAVSHTPLDAPPAPTHDKLAWRSAVFWVALVFSSFQVITAAFSPLSSQVVRAVHVGFVLLMIFLIEPGFSKKHGARAGFKPLGHHQGRDHRADPACFETTGPRSWEIIHSRKASAR